MWVLIQKCISQSKSAINEMSNVRQSWPETCQFDFYIFTLAHIFACFLSIKDSKLSVDVFMNVFACQVQQYKASSQKPVW